MKGIIATINFIENDALKIENPNYCIEQFIEFDNYYYININVV